MHAAGAVPHLIPNFQVLLVLLVHLCIMPVNLLLIKQLASLFPKVAVVFNCLQAMRHA